MRELFNSDEIVFLCKALSSPLRLNMLKLLSRNKQLNLNELAEQLNVTNGAISQHLKVLLDADLIDISYTSGKRGSQKICFLKEHKFLIDILSEVEPDNMYQIEIPIGSYTEYQVYPTCGIATTSQIIGEFDDPRYFDAPQRIDAAILWFSKGMIRYRVPNYLKENNRIEKLQFSFEISSEAPGICEDWPSDIHFHLNGTLLGVWTSPGDYGTSKGLYTPAWWFPTCNQYGLLKLLTIDMEGTYIDGRKISDVSISTLNLDHKSDIIFQLSVPDTAASIGGLTLFGKGFGNYNQDINVRVIFKSPT
ncbi:MAG: helix-turn-helix domain-containing protein [Clostridiaceae bacterium]|nr:helix-turn-helix domain-containing protein [Clostridiaceae bacterium]